MNEILFKLDDFLRILEFLVLGSLIYFINKATLGMLFSGKVRDGYHDDTSVFITAALTVLFHFIGNVLAKDLLSSSMHPEMLRKVFYTTMALVELSWFLSVYAIHKAVGCRLNRLSGSVMLLSLPLILVQLVLYVERVIIGADVLRGFARFIIVIFNIGTLSLLSLYVLYKLLLVVQRRLQRRS